MPERWQDELKKLRREKMPDGVSERAEAGPRRELPNDGRQRLVAGLVAFAVFIAAGAFAWRAFGDGSTTGAEPTPSPTTVPVVLDLSSNDGNPTATLSSGDASQDGIREGYTWCGPDGRCASSTADFVTYPPVSKYLSVPAGVQVEVNGDGRLDGLKTLLPNGDTLLVRNSVEAPVIPSVAGRWVWVVDAKWDDGSANYYFGIDVVPSLEHADNDGQVQDVLGCSSSTITTIDVTGSVPPEDQDWDSIVADSAAAIPGLLSTDTVRDAGSRDDPGLKDGSHVVVIRDGSVIATLEFQQFAAGGGSWSFLLDACNGSGLG
jgi:hypothetical protein